MRGAGTLRFLPEKTDQWGGDRAHRALDHFPGHGASVSAVPGQARLRALVVDDDDDIRVLMRRALERAGFEVFDFADAESLIASHEQLSADIVVSDIGLPGIDGIDVCASVLRRWPDLPVILVTAFRDEDLLRRAQAAGARRILTKPLNIADLASQAKELALHVQR